MPKKGNKVPDDSTVEKALREAVQDTHDSGTIDELTARLAWSAAESKLGVEQGWIKENADRKAWSKSIIQDAVDNPRPKYPSKKAAAAQPSPSPSPVQKKRKSNAATNGIRKRRKTDDSDDHASIASDSSASSDRSTPSRRSKSPDDSSEADSSKAAAPDTRKDSPDVKVDLSESELSELIDEAPPPKKRRQAKGSKDVSRPAKSKSKAAKPTKASKDADLSPDELEIRRLQGWLVKCGIRKIWAIYLKPYDTDKAKIKHLKQMLEDAGMTGRYSQEKATAIKDKRELASELDFLQEGNKAWGNDPGSQSGDASEVERSPTPPPKPRPKAASRIIDFGSDEDE